MKSIFVILFSLIILFVPQQVSASESIVINELLIHPSSGGKEWVEFYVTDAKELKQYWIDDDTDFGSDDGGSAKKSLENVVQGSDPEHYYIELSASMFNNASDVAILFKADGSIADQVSYTADPGEEITIGRYPDGTGSFSDLSIASRGGPNGSPRPTSTPTPLPTEKPTKEPSATKEPTSAKTLSTSTPTVRATIPISPTKKSGMLPNTQSKAASRGAYPTAILAIKTTAKPTAKVSQSANVKVKSASTTPALFTILGGGFIIACAVILFVKKFRRND